MRRRKTKRPQKGSSRSKPANAAIKPKAKRTTGTGPQNGKRRPKPKDTLKAVDVRKRQLRRQTQTKKRPDREPQNGKRRPKAKTPKEHSGVQKAGNRADKPKIENDCNRNRESDDPAAGSKVEQKAC
jgi:hypothetical protein